MNKLIYLLALLVVFACKSKNEPEKDTQEISTDSLEIATPSTKYDLNKLSLTEENEEILLGRIDRKGLQRRQFKPWFDSIYASYPLDTATLRKIKPLLVDMDLKVFMGTWCEDSQREIPALVKILDSTSVDFENLYITAVSRDKNTPQGYEEKYNIEYVPTIIFVDGNNNDIELGRIVEYPQESLEKDIHAILSGADYKHSYED
jgi:thiol-disulfide isomerase/thioredoxin